MSIVSEEKQRSERSQIFHFNSSKSKNTVVTVVRYVILMVVKIKHCSERSQIFHFSSSEIKQRSDRS